MPTGHLHADENVYDSLAEATGDSFASERWAFGTGFDDPLAGVDATVPDGVDAPALARQCLALGDDALVLSQRLALWCSNAHELEDEVALANIALDLLGQARLLLTRAAQADPTIRPSRAPAHIPDEDALAYWRIAKKFTNLRLAEVDDERDFARCIARLFLLSVLRLAQMTRVVDSPDPVLAAIAAKAVIELTYHREYAAGWVIRLGDGTELSHQRMNAAMNWAWWHNADLVDEDIDVQAEFADVVHGVCRVATIAIEFPVRRRGWIPLGRSGKHTDDLVALLADMQSVARANPDASW